MQDLETFLIQAASQQQDYQPKVGEQIVSHCDYRVI